MPPAAAACLAWATSDAIVLHFQEVTCAVASRATWRKGLYLFCLYGMAQVQMPICRTGLGPPFLRKKLHEAGFLVGTEHEVYAFNGTDCPGLELRVASRYYHESAWVRAHHAVNGLPALMVGNLSDRTSVHDAEVGALAFTHCAHPHALQHLLERGCLRKVQLAAKGVIGGFLTLEG